MAGRDVICAVAFSGPIVASADATATLTFVGSRAIASVAVPEKTWRSASSVIRASSKRRALTAQSFTVCTEAVSTRKSGFIGVGNDVS